MCVCISYFSFIDCSSWGVGGVGEGGLSGVTEMEKKPRVTAATRGLVSIAAPADSPLKQVIKCIDGPHGDGVSTEGGVPTVSLCERLSLQ